LDSGIFSRTALLRVLQEALHNVVKRSGVRRVEVQLSQDAAEIHLDIKDLGKSFDFEQEMQGMGPGSHHHARKNSPCGWGYRY